MKFTLEINNDKIVQSLELFFRRLIHFLYNWFTTDGEVLGYILGIWHFVFMIVILIFVILSHTFYTNIWCKLFVLFLITLIWIQHIVLNVCVVIVAEQKLTNSISPYFYLLKTLLNIDYSTLAAYTVIIETTAILCFSLEIISILSTA